MDKETMLKEIRAVAIKKTKELEAQFADEEGVQSELAAAIQEQMNMCGGSDHLFKVIDLLVSAIEKKPAYISYKGNGKCGLSYSAGMVVVPITKGSEANGHNYAINKPVFMMDGQAGLRGCGALGNAMTMDKEKVRAATEAEIDALLKKMDEVHVKKMFKAII